MIKFMLFGLRLIGFKMTLSLFFKFIQWWLIIGRKYRQNWKLGQWSFDFVHDREERMVEFDGKYIAFSQLPPFPSPAFFNMWFPPKSRCAQNNRVVLYPSFTNIAVTGRCQLRCWHCSAANNTNHNGDLPIETWKNIIQQLQDAGVYYIGITGGEPLLRDDLEEIISSIDERSVVALATSGMTLTPERVRYLKEAGLFYILVSLDHHLPEVHDRLRGFSGAYEAAVRAMYFSKEVGLYTILQTTMTKEFVTKDEIWRLAELGKKIGVQEIRCRGIVPTGRLRKIDRTALLTEEDRELVIQSAREINIYSDYPKVSVFEEFEHPTRFGCCAGSRHIYVDCNGNLCPCDFVPLSFGNLREETFDDIWLRMRSALGSPQRQCLACFTADHIADQRPIFPIPLEPSREICRHYRTPELPDMWES